MGISRQLVEIQAVRVFGTLWENKNKTKNYSEFADYSGCIEVARAEGAGRDDLGVLQWTEVAVRLRRAAEQADGPCFWRAYGPASAARLPS